MRFLAVLMAFAVVGCATGYQQFYTDLSADWAKNTVPPRKLEVKAGSSDLQADVYRMWEDGYALIGYSSFNGAFEGDAGAKAQAAKVGAEVVLVYSEYSDTAQGAIPLTTTSAVTTYGTGTVTAGGQVGTYSGTSTTYVPNTTMIPYAVRRYDQMASYFAPLKPACFGGLLGEPTDDDRRISGTNRLARVDALRRGSPAYNADLLPGDLVLEVGGKPFELDSWAAPKQSGETIALTVLRQSPRAGPPERLTKEVVLGSCE
jgi:hypothetical protein